MAKNEDEIGALRDDVIRRMIATPPKLHKDELKRRPTPQPGTRQLAKHRTNKPRKSKA